ncbi:CBN-GEI-17 protein [Aphelenchoides besseyi]|nr:CBN-GEI-17 protein [Aphelenchoides besseyi]
MSTNNIQEILVKLFSLRVSELQSILAQFGYAYRNQAKGVLQAKIRDELLKNPQLSSQVCALILNFYSIRYSGQSDSKMNSNSIRRPTNVNSNYSAQNTNHFQSMMSANRNTVAPLHQPSFSNHQPIDASRVKLVDLPFYDREATLLTAVALTNSSQSGVQTKSFRFSIPQMYLSNFSQNETDPLPRYEIQLRMGLLDPSKEQQDDYPKSVRANINGAMITFPPLLNVQPRPGQPQTEQKRQSRPVNISLACLPIRNQYQLNIDWQYERTNYFVVVYVVKHLTPQILHDRIKDSDRIYFEETREMVRKSLQKGGEDDIAMDSLKVSLLCPLSRSVMNTPSRSRNCSHLQCFDLLNYLMMSEKRPTWKCPVCGKACPYNSLVVDRYFSDIITKVNGKAKDIELLPDADFKIVGEKKSQDLSVQESKVMAQLKKEVIEKFSPTQSNASTPLESKDQIPSASATTSAPSSASNNRALQEVITLGDSSSSESESDGESSSSSNAVSSSAPASNMTNGSRKRTHAQSIAGSAPEVITLDSDSEDDVPVRKSPATTAADPANLLTFRRTSEGDNTPTTNIFDRNSVESCAATAEIAMDLFKFLQRIEVNGFAQNQ